MQWVWFSAVWFFAVCANNFIPFFFPLLIRSNRSKHVSSAQHSQQKPKASSAEWSDELLCSGQHVFKFQHVSPETPTLPGENLFCKGKIFGSSLYSFFNLCIVGRRQCWVHSEFKICSFQSEVLLSPSPQKESLIFGIHNDRFVLIVSQHVSLFLRPWGSLKACLSRWPVSQFTTLWCLASSATHRGS